MIALVSMVLPSAAQEKQCTILISFDGFRWDYLDRGLSPTIDSLWKSGVRAESLEPVYPSKTFPNHLAIVTGMYADHHGIIQNDFMDDQAGRRYKISDTVEVRDSRWYRGEAIWETAKKNGKITASYFWPGSELKDEPRQPDYFERYVHTRPYDERIKRVLEWVGLPAAKRPELITLYFDATDTEGHYYGPNSPQVNRAIVRLDSAVHALINGLRQLKLVDAANIIIVSDHGMTEIDLARVVVLEGLLAGERYRTQWIGPTVLLESENGRDKEIAEKLKKELKHARVFLKKEIPASFNFSDNEYISPVLIAADLGWHIAPKMLTQKDSANFGKGNHGYVSSEKDMHGILVASGPAFKKKFAAGPLKNIDVYPLLCKLLNISANPSIDAKFERIRAVLR